MSLNAKQAEFTKTVAEFILWCFNAGYPVIGAELFRTKEQAEIYAAQGKGILNSIHRKKLGIDLFLMKDGTITWEDEDYRPLAEKWASMHPLARAGYFFKNRDSVHFSFEHNGVY